MLLVAVYGGFLVLVGAMAVALAVLVSAHFSAAAISTTVAHDRALIRLWADASLTPADLDLGTAQASRIRDLQRQLTALIERGEILHIEVRAPGGVVLFGNHGGRGTQAPASEAFAASRRGEPSAELLDAGQPSEAVNHPFSRPLLREYLPIVGQDGEVAAVVGIWRDAAPILDRLAETRAHVIVLTAAGALVVAVVLLVVFRAAQRRLTRQGQALVETTRRDPLTGLLNHGAVVAGLAERIDVAHGAGAPLGVALVDVDNFRLLNDLHGHAAGDAVLLEVSRALGQAAAAGTLLGRYGPDEFLIVGPPMATEVAEGVVRRLQAALESAAVQFGDSEPLPIAVSGGLATYPEHAQAVTDLLMAATAAVGEAKASGGGAICRAGAGDRSPAVPSGFSVLQGLVLAIDTKDRYTKRHSEDVARYALFLGARLGLPPDELEKLRIGGLLHDVGKVGIPDALLRKPGRLTPEELEAFKQHVALGDLIVRDLPNLDEVRAGVRQHHERWDGAGYLDGLAGEQIPLIARILAVADAFSAMTTTRPYRKAISLTEALKRLGDGAGTQLEERLVREFVSGMETAADAPLPGDGRIRPRLWTPQTDAA